MHKLVQEIVECIPPSARKFSFEVLIYKRLYKNLGVPKSTKHPYLENHKVGVAKIFMRIWCPPTENDALPDINEVTLSSVLIAEPNKTYRLKQVEDDQRDDLFKACRDFYRYAAQCKHKINRQFQYLRTLRNNMMLATSNQQLFFAITLPSLAQFREDKALYGAHCKKLKPLV